MNREAWRATVHKAAKSQTGLKHHSTYTAQHSVPYFEPESEQRKCETIQVGFTLNPCLEY